MRRYITALILLLAGTAASARDTYNMNSGWRFFAAAATTSDGAISVVLPHTYSGVGNYVRELDVPKEWAGRRILLRGGGGGPVLTVFVNGRLAGEHRGGYNGWEFAIEHMLNWGARNEIHIVCSPAAHFDMLPTAGDMELSGGLFRDVELVVAGTMFIGKVVVQPLTVTSDRVEAQVLVKGRASVHVLDPSGVVVARASGADKIPFSIDNPLLWHGRQAPHLYNVRVRSLDDSVTVTTGFRTVAADPARGFLLNGQPYPLRGVVVSQDRPLIGAAISEAQVAEDVALIKGMGANAVRVAGVAHNPEFYDMCDREGIIVWSDFPLVGEVFLTDKAFVSTSEWRENAATQALDIIAQQRNHPCVAMWGIFSNLQNRGDNATPFVRELSDMVRQTDPSRLTAASSNIDGDINFATDLICWSHSFGWSSGLPGEINLWRDHFTRQWGGKLRSAVSYGAGGSIAHTEVAVVRPDPLGDRHPEAWQTHLHEEYYNALRNDRNFWGVFVCNMFDYAAPRSMGGERGVNDFGLVTLDRKVCKDAYYFYKANWDTDESFVYIAERRRTVRGVEAQEIKVYTNMSEAELFVNGISAGVRRAADGVCLWPRVALRRGANNVEVRSGSVSDQVRLEVSERMRQAI